MLDLGFLRANLPQVREKLLLRGVDPTLLDSFAQLDSERRTAITEAETLKAQRNALSQQIGQLKRTGGDTAAIGSQSADLKSRTEALEATAAEADNRVRTLLEALPNLPAGDVPAGTSEHETR